MDALSVRSALCEVIVEIQTISGLECPTLSGATKPVRDVKDFKSEVWPVAISMLEDKIGVEIPEDENLFYDAKAKTALSIDQCVEKVMPLVKKQVSTIKNNEAPDE